MSDTRLSAEERASKWNVVREQFGRTIYGSTLQALRADHEALASEVAELRAYDCRDLRANGVCILQGRSIPTEVREAWEVYANTDDFDLRLRCYFIIDAFMRGEGR